MNFCRNLVKDYNCDFAISLDKPHALKITNSTQEKELITEHTLATIQAMRNGTWLNACPVSEGSSSYSPEGPCMPQSYARFLNCNVSHKVSEELAKFENILLCTNTSFGGMGGTPVPMVAHQHTNEEDQEGEEKEEDEEEDKKRRQKDLKNEEYMNDWDFVG